VGGKETEMSYRIGEGKGDYLRNGWTGGEGSEKKDLRETSGRRKNEGDEAKTLRETR